MQTILLVDCVVFVGEDVFFHVFQEAEESAEESVILLDREAFMVNQLLGWIE